MARYHRHWLAQSTEPSLPEPSSERPKSGSTTGSATILSTFRRKRTEHADTYRADDPDRRFLQSRRWREKLRPWQLSREPLCEHCKALGHTVPAQEVDHIVRPRGDRTLQTSASNWQSLNRCVPKDSQPLAEEQRTFRAGSTWRSCTRTTAGISYSGQFGMASPMTSSKDASPWWSDQVHARCGSKSQVGREVAHVCLLCRLDIRTLIKSRRLPMRVHACGFARALIARNNAPTSRFQVTASAA